MESLEKNQGQSDNGRDCCGSEGFPRVAAGVLLGEWVPDGGDKGEGVGGAVREWSSGGAAWKKFGAVLESQRG